MPHYFFIVPNYDDLLKSSKPHIRKKRQFIPTPMSVPSRAGTVPSRNKPTSSNNNRNSNTEQIPPRIEPELLLFVDFALFKEFEGDSNELLEYLLHFWHAVSKMFFINTHVQSSTVS